MSAELIEEVILPALGGEQRSNVLADAAVISLSGQGEIAFTTDSYVVQPLEFPGGDIGKLAVCGTINDLAVMGAKPTALSLALVLAEGMEIAKLRQYLTSAGQAAREAGVSIVTGDTKVVQRGGVDSLIINTAGVGEILSQARLGFDRIEDGDAILLSGPLGEHGLTIMCLRKHLSLSSELASDCAAVHELTTELIDRLGAGVHWMRDPTRGGLAATLADLSRATGRDIEIDQAAIPINRTARAASEMLGLDLLTIANEGKLVAVVSAEAAEQAKAILSVQPIAEHAAIIGKVGRVDDRGGGVVEMITTIGGRRIVQMPYGEELPRIC